MTEGVFKISEKRPIRDEMTISRSAGLSSHNPVTWFSMGAKTSISQESYDNTILYLGEEGVSTFLLGNPAQKAFLSRGDFLLVPASTLCGAETEEGSIYTEIILEKESSMNSIVKPGEAIQLKNLISYEEGSIANLDVAHTDTMKFVLMAFDEGTGLSAHRAPGNAIVTALEGNAIIGYEGKDYPLAEGESFRFEKNCLHSVTAKGRFKMSLLLVLE